MDAEQLIKAALNGASEQAPSVPPAEWMMVGFTCAVQDIDIAGRKVKALLFWHMSAPNGVRFIFPLNDSGAREIGNRLLNRPEIITPEFRPETL